MSRRGLLLTAGAFVAGACLVFYASGWIPPNLLRSPDGNDVWFEGDLPVVARNWSHRWSDHSRTANHPLFPALTTVPVYAMRAIGLSSATAVRALSALVGGLWLVSMFAALRLAGRGTVVAVVFTLAAATSAAAVFWLIVPEAVALASVSVLVPIALAGSSVRRPISTAVEVVASAFSLSVTVSNWTAGLLLSFTRHPWRRALQISANAFCVVVVLWAAQRQLFPTADFFIGYSNYQRFVLRPEAGGPLAVARVFFVDALVMPEIAVSSDPKWGATLTIQQQPMSRRSSWGMVAAVAWLGLLTLGAVGLRRAPRPIAVLLAVFVAAQYVLHAVFGEETFLYVLHFVPALIVIASFGVETRARPVALVLAGVFTIAGGVNNVQQLRSALDTAGHLRALSPAGRPEAERHFDRERWIHRDADAVIAWGDLRLAVAAGPGPSTIRPPISAASVSQPFSPRTFTPVRRKYRAAFSTWRSFV